MSYVQLHRRYVFFPASIIYVHEATVAAATAVVALAGAMLLLCSCRMPTVGSMGNSVCGYRSIGNRPARASASVNESRSITRDHASNHTFALLDHGGSQRHIVGWQVVLAM